MPLNWVVIERVLLDLRLNAADIDRTSKLAKKHAYTGNGKFLRKRVAEIESRYEALTQCMEDLRRLMEE